MKSIELARPVGNDLRHGMANIEKQLSFLFPIADLRGKPQRLCQIHSVLLPMRRVARDFKANCKYCERI